MAQEINTLPASGTRDFLPHQVRQRERVFQIVRETFESFGFVPLQTPTFERLEILSGKYGDEGEKLIFKILKRGDKEQTGEADLALRYDLTVPALRAFADNRQQLPTVFKRYQIGQVWRADRPGKERFREFTQCDIDIYGSSSATADLEILLVINQTLRRLGLEKNIKIHLNSRLFLQQMTSAYELPPSTAAEIMIVLDKIDKIGLAQVAIQVSDIIQQNGLAKQCKQFLADIAGPNAKELFIAKVQANPEGKKVIADIAWLIEQVKHLQPGANIIFDPFLVRGISYYTGFIFEIFSPDSKSALSAGGRYDHLSMNVTGQSMPICGGSLGIERILLLLEKSWTDLDNNFDTLFLTVWDADSLPATLRLASGLRANGLKIYMSTIEKDLKSQLKFADKNKYRFCLILGPDEIKNQTLVVKDFVHKKQQILENKDHQLLTNGLLKFMK
ncbi:MAG: histidine--tRNA ligase [Rhodospirillaceae bacterium]|nr:histidine--tRNA ligase [Rhodospirillaceae bacterium]